MTNYAIVEEIVLEVLRKLENPNKLNKTDKACLLVINAPEDISYNHLKGDWDVIELTEKTKEISAEVIDVKKVVFSNVSQDLLVKGALGISDTFESKLLANHLMQGGLVELIPETEFDWIANESHTDKKSEYINQLLKYKKKLISYGVKILPFSESILSSSYLKNNKIHKITFHEKLLTKGHVDNFTNQNIMISKSTIVTPLAQDRARELGKNISVVNS